MAKSITTHLSVVFNLLIEKNVFTEEEYQSKVEQLEAEIEKEDEEV